MAFVVLAPNHLRLLELCLEALRLGILQSAREQNKTGRMSVEQVTPDEDVEVIRLSEGFEYKCRPRLCDR